MPEFIDWCPNIYHIVKTMIESPDDLHKEYPVLEIRNKPYISKGRDVHPDRKLVGIFKPKQFHFNQSSMMSMKIRHRAKLFKTDSFSFFFKKIQPLLSTEMILETRVSTAGIIPDLIARQYQPNQTKCSKRKNNTFVLIFNCNRISTCSLEVYRTPSPVRYPAGFQKMSCPVSGRSFDGIRPIF